MLLQVDTSRHDWQEWRRPYLSLVGAIDDGIEFSRVRALGPPPSGLGRTLLETLIGLLVISRRLTVR